jgi:hypothetical protein
MNNRHLGCLYPLAIIPWPPERPIYFLFMDCTAWLFHRNGPIYMGPFVSGFFHSAPHKVHPHYSTNQGFNPTGRGTLGKPIRSGMSPLCSKASMAPTVLRISQIASTAYHTFMTPLTPMPRPASSPPPAGFHISSLTALAATSEPPVPQKCIFLQSQLKMSPSLVWNRTSIQQCLLEQADLD